MKRSTIFKEFIKRPEFLFEMICLILLTVIVFGISLVITHNYSNSLFIALLITLFVFTLNYELWKMHQQDDNGLFGSPT